MFCVLFPIIFFIYSHLMPRPFDDPKNAILYAAIGILFIYKMYESRNIASIAINKPVMFLVVYIASMLFSLFSNAAPIYEGILAICRILLLVVLCYLISKLTREYLCRIIAICSLCGMFIATLCTLKEYLPDGLIVRGIFFMAPIGHVSYLGDFMSMLLPMAAYLFLVSKHFRRFLWVVCGFMILYGFWFSATRASAVGLILGSGVGLVALYVKRVLSIWRIALIIAAMIAITLTLSVANPHTLRGFSLTERFAHSAKSLFYDDLKNTGGSRFSIAKCTISGFKHPLTGWGAGSFRFIYPEICEGNQSYKTWTMHPHNEILNQLFEVGIPGLIAFAAFFVSIFVGAIGFLKQNDDRSDNLLVIMALSSLTVALASWQLSTTFLNPVIRLLACLNIGILWKYISPRFKRLCALSVPRSVSIGLIVVVTVMLFTYSVSLYATNRFWKSSDSSERHKFARIAHIAAPLAFDSLYTYTIDSFHTKDYKDAEAIADRLNREFPFVPVALHAVAMSKYHVGKMDEARVLEEHAVRNGFPSGKYRKN